MFIWEDAPHFIRAIPILTFRDETKKPCRKSCIFPLRFSDFIRFELPDGSRVPENVTKKIKSGELGLGMTHYYVSGSLFSER